MKFTKLILFLLLCNLIPMFGGCGGNSFDAVDDSQPPPPKVVKTTEIHYTILADENLQEDHKLAILRALNEWAVQTNHTFTYSLSFVDMSQEAQDTSIEKTIKIYVKDPGVGYLGWTSWDADNRSSFMFIKPSIDGELFRRVMLHELGHAFALDFNGDSHYKGPFESVMHPSIGEDSPHISCPELQAFCNEFGCQVDCTNVSAAHDSDVSGQFWKETQVSFRNTQR